MYIYIYTAMCMFHREWIQLLNHGQFSYQRGKKHGRDGVSKPLICARSFEMLNPRQGSSKRSVIGGNPWEIYGKPIENP